MKITLKALKEGESNLQIDLALPLNNTLMLNYLSETSAGVTQILAPFSYDPSQDVETVLFSEIKKHYENNKRASDKVREKHITNMFFVYHAQKNTRHLFIEAYERQVLFINFSDDWDNFMRKHLLTGSTFASTSHLEKEGNVTVSPTQSEKAFYDLKHTLTSMLQDLWDYDIFFQGVKAICNAVIWLGNTVKEIGTSELDEDEFKFDYFPCFRSSNEPNLVKVTFFGCKIYEQEARIMEGMGNNCI